MTKTAVPLAEIVQTRMLPRRTRSGTRLECFEAVTTDGEWAFERADLPGTPWIIRHVPTGEVVDWRGYLDDCRWFVAAGHAADALERLRAHGRGGHENERDKECPKC